MGVQSPSTQPTLYNARIRKGFRWVILEATET